MTAELVSELRRRLYDINTMSVTKSDLGAEFYQWRGMAMGYLQIMEWLGTVEDEIVKPPVEPSTEDDVEEG